MSGRWIDGSVRAMNGRERQRVNRAEWGKRAVYVQGSCGDEINGCNGLVQMEDRGGQGELGRKMKTITSLQPTWGFWEKVRGRSAWARFKSEALLALKLWTLVPAFIAPDVLSHNPPLTRSLSFIFFLYIKLSHCLECMSICRYMFIMLTCCYNV